MSDGIFICYRRDDSRHAAGRLIESLRQVFRREQLFMDVDTIEPGQDFADVLQIQIIECAVFLALIGPGWLDIRNAEGHRKLDDPDDFVRLEIETALDHELRVVPVLIDGARLPCADELPATLRVLVRRAAVDLRHERWGNDIAILLQCLERSVRPRSHRWVRSFADIRTLSAKAASHPPATLRRPSCIVGTASHAAITPVALPPAVSAQRTVLSKLMGLADTLFVAALWVSTAHIAASASWSSVVPFRGDAAALEFASTDLPTVAQLWERLGAIVGAIQLIALLLEGRLAVWHLRSPLAQSIGAIWGWVWRVFAVLVVPLALVVFADEIGGNELSITSVAEFAAVLGAVYLGLRVWAQSDAAIAPSVAAEVDHSLEWRP